jgi:hypothetical protein
LGRDVAGLQQPQPAYLRSHFLLARGYDLYWLLAHAEQKAIFWQTGRSEDYFILAHPGLPKSGGD